MRLVESVEVGAHGQEPVEAQLPGRQQHRHGAAPAAASLRGKRDGGGVLAEGRRAPSSGTLGTAPRLQEPALAAGPGLRGGPAPLRPQLPAGQASHARPRWLRRPRVQGLGTAHGRRDPRRTRTDPGCSHRPGTDGKGGQTPLPPYLRRAVPPGEEGAAAAASGGLTGGSTPAGVRAAPRPALPPLERPRARPCPGAAPRRDGRGGSGAELPALRAPGRTLGGAAARSPRGERGYRARVRR